MLRNCYFSAIILNYWNKIYSLQANTYLTATLEDTYQWVVDGILYALEHRKWLDPTNKLYTDPDAPDKVINRRIKCTRINFLISENRDKRKLHINLLSLDSFEDSDNLIGCGTYEYSHDNIFDLCRQFCNDSDALSSVIIDFIADGSCFVQTETGSEFSFENLVRLICNIDDKYIDGFVEKYQLDYEKTYCQIFKIVVKYRLVDLWGFGEGLVKRSYREMYQIVKNKFDGLKENGVLKSALC